MLLGGVDEGLAVFASVIMFALWRVFMLWTDGRGTAALLGSFCVDSVGCISPEAGLLRFDAVGSVARCSGASVSECGPSVSGRSLLA